MLLACGRHPPLSHLPNLILVSSPPRSKIIRFILIVQQEKKKLIKKKNGTRSVPSVAKHNNRRQKTLITFELNKKCMYIVFGHLSSPHTHRDTTSKCMTVSLINQSISKIENLIKKSTNVQNETSMNWTQQIYNRKQTNKKIVYKITVRLHRNCSYQLNNDFMHKI